MRASLLVLTLLLLPSLFSLFALGDPIPAQYPYAVITSQHDTSIHLSALPGEKSIIYSNATLHIFAPVNVSYTIYVDQDLYEKNVTESEHTKIPLHLSSKHHTIELILEDKTFTFDILVTKYAISEGAVEQLQRLIQIPPWEWTMHEYAVFGNTVVGALLAIPFAYLFARYMILRKWGGANVIS